MFAVVGYHTVVCDAFILIWNENTLSQPCELIRLTIVCRLSKLLHVAYMWYLPISAGAPDLEPFLTVSRSGDETSRREVFPMSFFSDRISVRTFYRLRQYLPGE